MKDKKTVYAIGHRNPDTDSICSAIGYAYLKQQLGENVVAARAGTIMSETKYALETFKTPAPLLVTDLYPRVRDVTLPCEAVVKETDSLRNLGDVLRRHHTKSVPVVDAQSRLIGIVTVSDLAKRYFTELSMGNLSEFGIDLKAIIEVVDGEIIVSSDTSTKITGNVRIAAASSKTAAKIVNAGDVVLVGDRIDDVMLSCLRRAISCMIVTSSGIIPPEVIEYAEQQHILLISSPHDTYTCARLVNQCIPVSNIMQRNVQTFKPTDMLSDIKGIMASTNYRYYPVLENDKLIGVVSRDELLTPEKERVILIDHNEWTQAVEGIVEAKIVEIIDHHRLGDIQTSEPIYTRQEPVGCTATIIANMYWHRDVKIPANIAGLLLSAIISDTVLFKSPTCTVEDKEAAAKLARLAGVDIQEYGMAMLKAGSQSDNMSPIEIVKNDLKEFQIGDYRVIVSQLSVMDPDKVVAIKDTLLECMEHLCETENYDMSVVLITDIIKEGTYLLFKGSPSNLIGEAFKQDASANIIYLPGVMSRKKQVIPPMIEAAQKLSQ